MSKAALDYFVTEAAIDSKASEIEEIQNATILAVNPGLLATDMGSPGVPIPESLGLGHLVMSPPEMRWH